MLEKVSLKMVKIDISKYYSDDLYKALWKIKYIILDDDKYVLRNIIDFIKN